MPRPKPRIAQLHEVIISREDHAFTINFRDGSLGPHHITVQDDIRGATDAELLDRYNDVVRAMQQLRDANPYVAVEVPPGLPQIQYSPLSDQWVPRGGVLRCEIEDNGPGGEAVIVIPRVLGWHGTESYPRIVKDDGAGSAVTGMKCRTRG